MKIIDLSHDINDNITVYPGSPKPSVKPYATHAQHGYAELIFTMTTHTGTHIDTPYHILPNGKNLSQLPIEQFVGKAYVIKPIENKFDLATVLTIEHMIDQIDFILLQTNQEKFWNSEKYFNDYPVLTTEAAQWLANKKIKGVGIDAISIDKPNSTELTIHKILLSSGLIILENLKNIWLLPQKIFSIFALPLKMENADGAPARIIAIID